MRPKHLFIYFPLAFSCYANFSPAQNIEEQMTKSHATCQSIFMNAMDILPGLYGQKAFDSMEKAVTIWERSCYDMPEVKITRLLLDMETSAFTMSDKVDAHTIDLLSNYAGSFPSNHKMQDFESYKEPKTIFYRFASTWAKLLLEKNQLDDNEKFICKVLIGEIRNPEKEIRQHPEIYAAFVPLEEKNFENKRKEPRLNFAFGTGVWLPTNNLTTLGVHPSFTVQFGLKNMFDQLDVSMQIRYLHSPSVYAVKKDDQFDSTDYYLGYYFGAEYTHYFVAQKRFDLGIEVGAGYDAFDFKEQPYYYYYDPYYYNPNHFSVGSFNGNAGLRFNYYFTHSFYLGLLGRYNGIHYSTDGGTNLRGDAITIDLIFGFNGIKDKK